MRAVHVALLTAALAGCGSPPGGSRSTTPDAAAGAGGAANGAGAGAGAARAARSAAAVAATHDLTGVWTNDPPESTSAFQNFSFSREPPALTAWGKERYDAAKPTFGEHSVPVGDTNDPVYQCFPPGTPRVYLHPFPVEIVETSGRLLMLFEYDHTVRQIYTDGREHRTDLAPMWMGDSTGRWEGDTLVVDSTNFNDKSWLDRRGVPHSDQLHVVERIKKVGSDRLEIDITMEDPVALAAPWVAQRFLKRTSWQVEEHACMDNVNFASYEEGISQFDKE
jgi:hypothetical protein